MKRAVLFDLYGTLIDIRTDEHAPEVYGVLADYLSYHRVHTTPEALRMAYAEGVKRHLRESAEPYPEVDVSEVFREVMEGLGGRAFPEKTVRDTVMLFRSLTIRRFGAFEGLFRALAEISRSYASGIISDAQWVFAEPEIEKVGLKPFFPCRILSSRFGFKKPDPRLFTMALDRLRVRRENAVYIGDNPGKDLEGARRAGLRFILFQTDSSGGPNPEADAQFSQYAELPPLLKSLLP